MRVLPELKSKIEKKDTDEERSELYLGVIGLMGRHVNQLFLTLASKFRKKVKNLQGSFCLCSCLQSFRNYTF